jgi:hypothetical protein
MPGGERRKPIDIEDRRTKVKVTTSKNRKKRYFFRENPINVFIIYVKVMHNMKHQECFLSFNILQFKQNKSIFMHNFCSF